MFRRLSQVNYQPEIADILSTDYTHNIIGTSSETADQAAYLAHELLSSFYRRLLDIDYEIAKRVDEEWWQVHRDYLSRVRMVAYWLSIAHMSAIPPFRRLIGTQIKRILIWEIARSIGKAKDNENLRDQLKKLANSLGSMLEIADEIIKFKYKLYNDIVNSKDNILRLNLVGGFPIPEDDERVKNLVEFLYLVHDKPELGSTFTCALAKTVLAKKPDLDNIDGIIERVAEDIYRAAQRDDNKDISINQIKEMLVDDLNYLMSQRQSILDPTALCNPPIGSRRPVSLLHALLYPRGYRYDAIENYIGERLCDNDKNCEGDIRVLARRATLLVYLHDSDVNIINLLIFITKYKFIGTLLGFINTVTNILPEVLQELHTLRCNLGPEDSEDCVFSHDYRASIAYMSPLTVARDLLGVLDDLLVSIEAFYAALSLHIFTHIYYEYKTNGKRSDDFQFHIAGDETRTFRGLEVPCCLFRVDLRRTPTLRISHKTASNTYFYQEFIPNYLCLVHNILARKYGGSITVGNRTIKVENCEIMGEAANYMSKLLIQIPRFAYVESESAPSAHVRDLLSKLYVDVRAGQSMSLSDHQEQSIHTRQIQNRTFVKNYSFQLMLDAVMSQLHTAADQALRQLRLFQTLRHIIMRKSSNSGSDNSFYIIFNHYYYSWLAKSTNLRYQFLGQLEPDGKTRPGIIKLIETETYRLEHDFSHIPPIKDVVGLSKYITALSILTYNLAKSYNTYLNTMAELAILLGHIKDEDIIKYLLDKELEDVNDYTLLSLIQHKEKENKKEKTEKNISFWESINFAIQSDEIYEKYKKIRLEENPNSKPKPLNIFNKLLFFSLTHSYSVGGSLEDLIRENIIKIIEKELKYDIQEKNVTLYVNLKLPSAGAMKLGYHKPDAPSQDEPDVRSYLAELNKKIHFLVMATIIIEGRPKDPTDISKISKYYQEYENLIKDLAVYRNDIHNIIVDSIARYFLAYEKSLSK